MILHQQIKINKMGNTVQYGYISLKRQSPKEIHKVLKQMDGLYIDISSMDQEVLKDALSLIEEHRANRLQSNHRAENILKFISHISLPQLTQLNLWGSKIVSVEVLPRIHIPQLQQLSLSENRISTVQPLRKAVFPNLKILVIESNELRECNWLQQANFQLMKVLSAELPHSSTVPQNVRCLFKLSTKTMRILDMGNNTRIDQPAIRRQLSAKYPGVSISHSHR